jgi:hypothetical protein
VIAAGCLSIAVVAAVVGSRADSDGSAAAPVTLLAPVAPTSTYDRRTITEDTGDIDPVPTQAPTATAAAATDPLMTASVQNSSQGTPTSEIETSAAPIANCAVAGTLSIPAIHVEQTILAESQPFASGLLCGNEDETPEGVDILPDYAAITDSVAGGDRLKTQVPAVIFGHRNSHNRPFFDLPALQPGDVVSVRLVDSGDIELRVVDVILLPLEEATRFVLDPSPDGTPTVRLVACARLDGSPGGTMARWIVNLAPR